MDYYIAVGAKIKELRLSKNMSRSELAEGICSVSHISRIETGSRSPNSQILRHISNRLGISADILLRLVESPVSLELYELINQLLLDMEYNRFEKVFEITSSINIEEVFSLEDKQIIMTLNYLCENIIKSVPEITIKRLQEILDLSYSDGTQPTDIEFGILTEIAFCHMQLRDFENARKIISFTEEMSEKTLFHRVLQPLVRCNLTSAIIAYHENSFEKAHKFIDKAISNAKTLNFHATLVDCYHAKGRIYDKQDMKEKAVDCYNNSRLLADLLFDSDVDLFIDNFDYFFDIDI